MTEDLKIIVNNINDKLKTNYNLISFDALSIENLLQTLIDILNNVGASTKFSVKDTDPAVTNQSIIDSLKKIQFNPNTIQQQQQQNDPGAFRRNLLQGDKKTIYPILRYIFENIEHIKNLTYLAQFLIPLNLPPEAISNPDIANLWNEYQIVMDEFKEAHRIHQNTLKENTEFRELRSDINIIEAEKENVQKRIERNQARLDKIPQQELFLEAAYALRVERERNKELQTQLENQRLELQRTNIIHDRLQKDLSNARNTSQNLVPEYLLENITGETQVLEFMVNEKLPKELKGKQSDVQILEDVINQPNITNEYLQDIQNKIEKINRDVQKLMEHQITERGSNNENLMPFRQQASMVARNKEMAAVQLDQSTKELHDIEYQIKQKQDLLHDTVGEVILRGDELKQYVNALRTKSSVYKQQRSELASVKADVSDLQQTMDNLKQQDPTLNLPTNNELQNNNGDDNSIDDGTSSIMKRNDSSLSIDTYGVTELTRLVDGLQRGVNAARERISPLSQKTAKLREKLMDLKEQVDIKKQAYNSLNATLSAEAAAMSGEIAETEKIVKKLEVQWQELKGEQERIGLLLEKAREELHDHETGNKRSKISLQDTLNEQIQEQENLSKSLVKENQTIKNNRDNYKLQQNMWADLFTLINVKIQCLRDAKQAGAGGTLVINKGAETFTLQ